MAFSDAGYVDARHSTFTQVGRDQIIQNCVTLIISPSVSPQNRPRIAVETIDTLPQPIYCPGTSLKGCIVSYSSSNVVGIVDAAVGLIEEITELLMDCRQSSKAHLDFALELESLQRTLSLTRLAIQMYENQPLGQSLANTIAPEVLRCYCALWELFDSINGTWLDVSINSIGGFWRRIWCAWWDGDEFSLSRQKLSYSRQSLQGLLTALRSVAWMDLGNELHAGFVSLTRFHDSYNNRLPSLYHIKLDTVDVMSHLGYNIPIPTMFCVTWEDFDYVVQFHCRDRMGVSYIERGAYEVIRAEDSQIIGPSELASMAQPGMKLEISIVMRQRVADQRKCPRCGYINLRAAVRGWIECHQCSGQFRIAEADRSSHEQSDTRIDEDLSEKVDEENGGNTNTESGDEQIVSFASQQGGVRSKKSPSQDREENDASGMSSGQGVHSSDDPKFFRRIHVVCMMNQESVDPTHFSFAAHGQVITCLIFSHGRIISASDDHEIHVYSPITGEQLLSLDGHEGGVWALAADGDTLASGSTDRTVRIWNLSTGRCTHVFGGHTSTVRSLAIVMPEWSDIKGDEGVISREKWPKQPLMVTGSRDHSLRVWALPRLGDVEYKCHDADPVHDVNANPYHKLHLEGHDHAVRTLAARGRMLVSGSYDCTVRVWDIITGDCKWVLSGHTQKVYSVVLNASQNLACSGSMDSTVRVWNILTGQCQHTLTGHTSLVGLLGLSPSYLVSASADKTLRIWDPDTGELRSTLAHHVSTITCFQHDELKVLSGSDGALTMWNIQDGMVVRHLLTGINNVWQVRFEGQWCIAASNRNGSTMLDVWDFGNDKNWTLG